MPPSVFLNTRTHSLSFSLSLSLSLTHTRRRSGVYGGCRQGKKLRKPLQLQPLHNLLQGFRTHQYKASRPCLMPSLLHLLQQSHHQSRNRMTASTRSSERKKRRKKNYPLDTEKKEGGRGGGADLAYLRARDGLVQWNAEMLAYNADMLTYTLRM